MTLPSFTSYKDLVTTHEATCQGFLEQAKVKAEKAVAYLADGMRFWEELTKTARSAFDRVAKVFASKRRKPALFFVGAAIEEAAAEEIFHGLQSGKLKYAANRTVPQQITDLISWLVEL